MLEFNSFRKTKLSSVYRLGGGVIPKSRQIFYQEPPAIAIPLTNTTNRNVNLGQTKGGHLHRNPGNSQKLTQ